MMRQKEAFVLASTAAVAAVFVVAAAQGTHKEGDPNEAANQQRSCHRGTLLQKRLHETQRKRQAGFQQ